MELERYKQLANDALIEYFGRNDRPAQLAEALEKCVDELSYRSGTCDVCCYCEVHGEKAGDKPEPIEASEVLEIHSQLKERLSELEQVREALANAEWDDRDDEIDNLQEHLVQLKTDLDELEGLAIP